jgi:hypothetical protein
MTALKKYQRLECSGLWRETPLDQRREVLVRFGEATLILSDPRSGEAMSHWSLPAVERINRGEDPPVFAPGRESTESLELDDPDMIAALEAVHAAVKAAVARPGRLRGLILAGTTLALVAGGAFWLPGALVAHTASVLPLAQRADLGQRALDDLSRLTGAPCDNQLGLQALATLSERVFGPVDTPILYVLPEGVDRPLHLPGDVIILPRKVTLGTASLIAAFETAQIPATPYALATDPDGTLLPGLAAGDPYKGLAPSPLIPDESWVALQGICGD